MSDPARPPLPGASQLMRSLGLLVDGPLRWGSPVPSRAPGVFVVELDQPLTAAPIDQSAVRRWIEHVPSLRLDGERPTVADLARRLAEFWLADEPIVYVGSSARTIGARLAAIYATPLGDARPAAGGHWLRTLADQQRMRVWWAETDAHEEYEDALLAEIAARQPAPVRDGLPNGLVLPFANLTDSSGAAKPHGLTDYTREPPADRDIGQQAKPAKPKAAGRPRQRQPARCTTRRSTIRAAPPAPEPTYLSQAGLDSLLAELEQLRSSVRPVVIERVKAARELGDLRENAEYESARKEQSFVEGRIQALEAHIKAAVVVEAAAGQDAAGVGSTVVVDSDGEQQAFVLVGSTEADPASGRISYASPVGQALLGRRAGDEVAVRLPRGEVRYVVVEVR
jgi:transcription elongation factor GreA